MLLIVPADPLKPRRPDDHFAAEASAAKDIGVPVALVDHDAWSQGKIDEAISQIPSDPEAIYRGWMVSSVHYHAFEEALACRNTNLVTTGKHYQRAHEFPGWYETLASLTPLSAWTQVPVWDAYDNCLETIGTGAAVIRDHVKSMKHYWDTACFIPDVTDKGAARRVAQRFVELRGDDLTGGLVIRQFEKFVGSEVRTWWVNGTCTVMTAHPDTPDQLPPEGLDVSAITPLIAQLGLSFVTVDLAFREDGIWRVIELGDGQVSDRPSSIDPSQFINSILSSRGISDS